MVNSRIEFVVQTSFSFSPPSHFEKKFLFNKAVLLCHSGIVFTSVGRWLPNSSSEFSMGHPMSAACRASTCYKAARITSVPCKDLKPALRRMEELAVISVKRSKCAPFLDLVENGS